MEAEPDTGGWNEQEVSAQLQARNSFWEVTDEATESDDFKVTSQSAEWRSRALAADAEVMRAVECDGSRLLKNMTNLVRSKLVGRAQESMNPDAIRAVLQPAVNEGLIERDQVDLLIRIAKEGISVEDFRDLDGPALDLLEGNATEPEDEEELLSFYMEQRARGICFILGPEHASALDELGEVVLSPSFLVRVLGKKARSILNLSSTDFGVNQRLLDVMVADEDGYTTIPEVCKMIVDTFVRMTLSPEEFGLEDIEKFSLAFIVADAENAFFRLPVAAEAVGIQCARVAGYTVIPMCCTFGWCRSAEVFSKITAAIKAAHTSDLNAASFFSAAQQQLVEDELLQELNGGMELSDLAKLLADKNPRRTHGAVAGHCDDFACAEAAVGARPRASIADLIFAVKSLIGQDGLSVKKFKASTFWSDLQKMIGCWFDVENFAVVMPREKIMEVLDILESEAFAAGVQKFEVDACATLRGKLRWAAFTTKIGEAAALVNIEANRRHKGKNAMVKPTRRPGESQELATAKFHNDMRVYRTLLRAMRDNPRLASRSMVSVLKLEDRMRVPGQSEQLVWLGGDFSMEGQACGVELLLESGVYLREWCFIPHPQRVLDLLREALAGNAKSKIAIMSSVLERQNKLFAEFQWRQLIAGRPCICCEDNTGSVACMTKGYSHNVHMQVMQLLSNTRQSVDEAPMDATWVSTKNMGIYDETSRLNFKFVEKMNEEYRRVGWAEWVRVLPGDDMQRLSGWLADAIDQPLPLLDQLLEELVEAKPVLQTFIAPALSREQLSRPVSLKWQDRVRAAKVPMDCFMGSFGPNAYNTDHLESDDSTGAETMGWRQLKALNRCLLECPMWTLTDAYSGACGATISAIQAGIAVQAGFEVAVAEVERFEELTGAKSLGDITKFGMCKLKPSDVFVSCSSCKNFARPGDGRGMYGSLGGDHFVEQFVPAAAAKAAVVILENVWDVALLHGGAALAGLQANAKRLGYERFFYKRVVFARHGDPENRVRIIVVAFSDAVDGHIEWSFPAETEGRQCAADVLQCSNTVPARFWDARDWEPTTRKWKRGDTCIHTLGYMNKDDTLGPPLCPNTVVSITGLLPTVTAAGNTRLVRVLRLYALWPLHQALRAWAWGKVRRKVGTLQNRRVMPQECESSKGFPRDLPRLEDKEAYRCAGNSVPIPYFTRLLKAVVGALEEAGVQPLARVRRAKEAQLPWCRSNGLGIEPDTGMWKADIKVASNLSGARKGYHVLFDAKRAELDNTAITEAELVGMGELQKQLKLTRLGPKSIDRVNSLWRSWVSFTRRFSLPLYMKSATLQDQAAVATVCELFMLYELRYFDQKAQNVEAKLWAVGCKHDEARLPNPIEGNLVIKKMMLDALNTDKPVKRKCPLTSQTMRAIKQGLDLQELPQFTFWVGLRFAIVFLCRISEWSFDGQHAVRWKHVCFYDRDHKKVMVKSVDDLRRVFEVEVIFYSSKTFGPEHAMARNWYAMDDVDDDRCAVRDLARLWLRCEQQQEHSVFSWEGGEKGVTRDMTNRILKAAAIQCGIPGADVASHSCRISGFSRCIAMGMSYLEAKTHGRWLSDCAMHYFWPATTMTLKLADCFWDAPSKYARIRGSGAVQRTC